MTRRKRKKRQNEVVIDPIKLTTMLPGMLISAKVLIEFGDSEWKKGDTQVLYPGAMASSIIISAQCAELLLKYKIKREGHHIERDHDLCCLYEKLKDESKVAIEIEFNRQQSKTTLPDGWDSVQTVFEKTRNALVDWRYAVEPTNQSLIYPHALYIATVSVYKTIPINQSGATWKEVTDPVIKDSVFRRIGK